MNSPEHLKDLAHRERRSFSYFYAAHPRRAASSERRSQQFGAESISSLRPGTPVSQRMRRAFQKSFSRYPFCPVREFQPQYARVL
jgi:hypothetical protein